MPMTQTCGRIATRGRYIWLQQRATVRGPWARRLDRPGRSISAGAVRGTVARARSITASAETGGSEPAIASGSRLLVQPRAASPPDQLATTENDRDQRSRRGSRRGTIGSSDRERSPPIGRSPDRAIVETGHSGSPSPRGRRALGAAASSGSPRPTVAASHGRLAPRPAAPHGGVCVLWASTWGAMETPLT
jgi:hypothetical protein